MAKLSPTSRVLLIELGNRMLNNRAGQNPTNRNPEDQCFNVALTWCQENKRTLQSIARYAAEAEKGLARNLERPIHRFFENMLSDIDVMHFLAFDRVAKEAFLPVLVITTRDPEAFADTCRLLRELTT